MIAEDLSWVNRYVGIPWAKGGRDERGADCWGLVRLVLSRERGIETPLYDAVSSEDVRAIALAFRSERRAAAWTAVPLDDARPFDVATMLGLDIEPGRVPSHIGVVVGRGMLLHVERATHSVCVPIKNLAVRHRVVEVCRHRELL